MHKKPSKSQTLAVVLGLALFGILYNALIGWMERKRALEGYTAYAVALGTVVTLGGVALLDFRAAAISLLGFIASGFPMILGSSWRYIDARKRERDYERQTSRVAVPGGIRQG